MTSRLSSFFRTFVRPQPTNRRLSTEQLEQRRLLTSIASVSPPQNYNFAIAGSVIEATFQRALDSSTQYHGAIVARGQQSSLPANQTVTAFENKLVLPAATDYHAGELVQVTVKEIENADVTAPFTWQFRAAAEGGAGIFHRVHVGGEISGSANDVAIGDLDGDGDLDAFMVADSRQEQVWINQGGHLAIQEGESKQSVARSVSLGDIDNDGDLDAVLGTDRGVAMRINSNDGEFAPMSLLGRSRTSDAALSDVDGDGDLDVITVGAKTLVWLNDGAGEFSQGQEIESETAAFGNTLRKVNVGDLDGDGDMDLFLSGGVEAQAAMSFHQTPASTPSVWLNDGTGTFTAGQTVEAFGSVELGDVDGDGDLDALLGGLSEGYETIPMQVLKNNGDATFDSSPILGNSHMYGTRLATFGDLDGDRDLDILNNQGQLWLNDGTGVFQQDDAQQDILPEMNFGSINALALGDLDGDRDLDALVVSPTTYNPSMRSAPVVWLNADTQSDVSVQIADDGHLYAAGAAHEVNYRVELANDGTEEFREVELSVEFDSQLSDVEWTCGTTATSGCDPIGTGDISQRLTVPGQSSIEFLVTARIPETARGALLTSASAALPDGLLDANLLNDSAQDKNLLQLLAVTPSPNSQTSSTTAGISLSSAANFISTADITDLVAVHGSKSGNVLEFDVESGPNGFTLTPSTELVPGEQVQVTVTNDLQLESETEVGPYVWSYQVGTSGGTGHFSQSHRIGQMGVNDVALGDLDQDGDQDLLLSRWDADRIVIDTWLNEGNGEFVSRFAPKSASSQGAPVLSLADFNGDGHLDALGPGRVWLGAGDGDFERGASVRGLNGVHDIADVDGDGDQDVVGHINDGVRVWKNDGAGEFTQAQTIRGYTGNVRLGDVDADGDVDLWREFEGRTTLWENDGSGEFTRTDKSLPAFGFLLGDFDADGAVDAYVGNGRILTNDGEGNLGSGSAGAGDFYRGSVGDFDGDGDLDVVDNQGVWLNDGNVTLRLASSNTAIPNSVDAFELGDLDGDGDLDLITAGYEATRVWLNADVGADLDFQVVSNQTLAEGAPTALEYSVQIANIGPTETASAEIEVAFDPQLEGVSWTCTNPDGEACPTPDGIGGIRESVELPVGSTLLYAVTAQLPAEAVGDITTAGSARLSDGRQDIGSENNSARLVQKLHPFRLSPAANSNGVSSGVDIDAVRPAQDLQTEEAVAGNLMLHTPLQAINTEASAMFEVTADRLHWDLASDLPVGTLVDATLSGWNTAENEPIPSSVWQFRTGVQKGTGILTDSGQSLTMPPQAYGNTVALADIDGDNDFDAITTVGDRRPLIWLNDGKGQFQLNGDGLNPGQELQFADLDADGDQDVFLGTNGANRVFLNDGMGNFERTDQRLGRSYTPARGVALGDIDADGDIDALVVEAPSFVGGQGATTLGVWANDGDGQFTSVEIIELGGFDAKPALADLDADGDLDVAVSSGSTIQLFFNAGDGHFSSGDLLDDGYTPGRLTIVDVDADGDVDLLGSKVWLNQGGRFFPQDAARDPNQGNQFLAVGDLDADGDLDAIDNMNAVWTNDGLAAFQQTTHRSPNTYANDAALADLDGDGDLDAVVVMGMESKVLLNADVRADLRTTIQIDQARISPGAPVSFEAEFTNQGIEDASDVTVSVQIPAVDNLRWQCESSGQAVCNAEGEGMLDQIADLPVGSGLHYRFTGTAAPTAAGRVIGTANAALPSNLLDVRPTNDLATASFTALPLQVDPPHNSNDSPKQFEVTATRHLADLDPASVQTTGIAIAGSLSGTLLPDAMELVADAETIRIVPNKEFHAGEIIQLTTSGAKTTSGEPLPPQISQFRIATQPGEGDYLQAETGLDGEILAVGDLNGDGTIDAITRNKVWMNLGGIVFKELKQDEGGASWLNASLIDIDVDGDLDIVTSGGIWRNSGEGQFSASPERFLSSSAYALGDLDGDGDADAFVGRGSGNRVLLNDGTGGFVDTEQAIGNVTPQVIRLGDIDGDGDLDAVTGIAHAADIIWFNDGSGNFELSTTFGNDYETERDFALGDIDADGDVDVITAGDNGFVWRNDGFGEFAQSSHVGGYGSESVTLGDFDGDHDLDLLVTSSNQGGIWVNDGKGGFRRSTVAINRGVTSGIAILADLDADGDLDAVTGRSVWENAPRPDGHRPDFSTDCAARIVRRADGGLLLHVGSSVFASGLEISSPNGIIMPPGTAAPFGFILGSTPTKVTLASIPDVALEGSYVLDVGWDVGRSEEYDVVASIGASANSVFTDTLCGIFRWDSAELIPGTEQLVMGPGLEATELELTFASLEDIDLSEADFTRSDLSRARFDLAVLSRADFSGAIIHGADFSRSEGFTKEQLYSTASYEASDLSNLSLAQLDIAGWDLSGQDLTGANLERASLAETDLRGANLANARVSPNSVTSALLDSTTTYNQWTAFPNGFDPTAAGLTFVSTEPGDFDADGDFDATDLARLEARVDWQQFLANQDDSPRQFYSGAPVTPWLNPRMFDLDGDARISASDLDMWFTEVAQPTLGDADLNGAVEFSDFLVLSANFGKVGRWSQGDFDRDGVVALSDFQLLADNFEA